MKIRILLLLTIVSASAFAQKKKDCPELTLIDVWASPKFFPEYMSDFKWMKDSDYYTEVNDNSIYKVNIYDNKWMRTVVFNNTSDLSIDDYQFNTDETKILISTNTESIYRYSSKAEYYVYDRDSNALKTLSNNGQQMFATFSPDGSKVAFVRDNNLFVVNLSDMSETQITTDGEINKIKNGWGDWVYEEEFEFTKTFFWSPKSDKIAFVRFDETEVPEYNMQVWGDSLYPQEYKFKYPKAGERNSDVQVWAYNLEQNKTTLLLDETGNDTYIPRIQWTKNNDILSVRKLNRLQNHLQVIHINTTDTSKQVVYEEQNDTYIEINDDFHYLATELIFISEKSGWNHIYKINLSTSVETQLTKGEWEVTSIDAVDEGQSELYFSSTQTPLRYGQEANPPQNSITDQYPYILNLTDKTVTQLTNEWGVNEISVSPDFKRIFLTNAKIDAPPQYLLITNGETSILEKNQEVIDNMEAHDFQKPEYFSFTTTEGIKLTGWMIKPPNFKEKNKYPVLMSVYGGPGHNTTRNEWMGPNYAWFQLLAQKGYIIVSVDGRGTYYKGAEFKKATYEQLGKLETKDQIAVARYLGFKKYIDPKRIGIWGWSFGGYLTSLCMTKGADYFKTGIAVAPVTNWRYYDNIYTERYMGLPKDNPHGYDGNSPVNFVEKMKGNFLLIHGTGDDNVHFQNSVMLQNALIDANKYFDSFFYPDRNHGIYGGITRYHLYNMMTDFILEKL